jgi:UDP-N-acetylglucosamine 2-epimerase (non-hydrolysing)/GDP/UDP-N,N'-diacetylbacillosamine 2-epimerase (hydrolysing)
MHNKRKIVVVTGSRADYGLLYWLMKDLNASNIFELYVVATGMHLSPEFGLTVKDIENDGFSIAARVESLVSSDTGIGIAKSVGLGVIGFADAIERIKPDLFLVLGDRFEIFAAAQAALYAGIPIAHIGGGDITEGAFDEAMRHGISKMAHIHFVTNSDAATRLMRMGENPAYIFNVGSPGLDHIHRSHLLSKDILEFELSYKFQKSNFLVTFHPVTLDEVSSVDQLEELLRALEDIDLDVGLIFTQPNSDTEGRLLTKRIEDFVASRKNAKLFSSLGNRRYLSVMAQVDIVIGNSSSGLYEAPSIKVPTVNIGLRQQGRLKAESIFDCLPEKGSILKAIEKAKIFDCQKIINPFKVGDCAKLILEQLSKIENYNDLKIKHFFD